MTLAPEPPEIYRHGSRRRGGLQVEPIFIIGGTVSKFTPHLYQEGVFTFCRATGTIQIIGGEQGLIANIDPWEAQAFPALSGTVDIEVAQALSSWHDNRVNTNLEAELQSTVETEAAIFSQYPAAFVDGDKLHLLIIRQRVLFQKHDFYWALNGQGGSVISWGVETIEGAVKSIADALHVEVDLVSKDVTYATQNCFSMSLELTDMDQYGATVFAVDFERSCVTQSIVPFLAQQTGINASAFSVAHSPGASWTEVGENLTTYGLFTNHWGLQSNWTDDNSFQFDAETVVPGANVFMPWGLTASHRKNYWANGFINWPGWLGLNRDAGYILAGDLSNRVVEISTFNGDASPSHWGRSSLSDYVGSTQLLDAEELFVLDALEAHDVTNILGPPRDHDFIVTNGAKQGVPLDWPDTAADASAPIEPQYFWSNAETLIEFIYLDTVGPGCVGDASSVVYLITD